jgi:hypothetical protein
MNNDRNKTARLAGLIYLVTVFTGIFHLVYVPTKLIVWKDSSQTLENLINNEFLFRFGITAEVIMLIAFLLLPIVLYKLLNQVNQNYAKLMVVFVFISIPFSFANVLKKFSVLTLIKKPDYLQNLSTEEIQTQLMFFLDSYSDGINVSQVFWGLWLMPFGYLVYKSGFLPKILGVFLIVGGVGYLIEFFAGFLISNYYNTMIPKILKLPSTVGEIGTCLWLLIMGTNKLNIGKNSGKHHA